MEGPIISAKALLLIIDLRLIDILTLDFKLRDDFANKQVVLDNNKLNRSSKNF